MASNIETPSINPRKVKIGVITINRAENNAYIWVTKTDPYWSTNMDISLVGLEYYLKIKFDDNYGWYWISFNMTEEEWEGLYALKN